MIRFRELGVGRRELEDGSWKTGVGRQESEVGSRESGVGVRNTLYGVRSKFQIQSSDFCLLTSSQIKTIIYLLAESTTIHTCLKA